MKIHKRQTVIICVCAAASLSVLAAVSAIYFMNEHLETDEEIKLPRMTAPRLVISKGERKLQVLDGERFVAAFAIGLGFEPDGNKSVEGDGRTPEGDFYIFTKNPESRFFLSLGISYPTREDADRGLAEGLISDGEHRSIVSAIDKRRMPPQKTKLGGEIYIHGGGSQKDWTEGCVALKNNEMQALFDAIPVGTPVTIRP